MDQSQILIAEMSDADGIQIVRQTRVEPTHSFIQSIRAISKRDKAAPIQLLA
jgi:hypothetical protein